MWTDLSAADGTTAIVGGRARGDGGEEPFVVSPAGESFQSMPQLVRLGDGHLAVWQADGPDGGLYGVFAQRFDAAGRPVGERFQVNEESAGDQRDPVVVADRAGGALVVWSSYGGDGERGRVVARRVDRRGWPLGGELTLAEGQGRLERPLASFTADGGFVVAWATRGEGETPPTVAYRRFDAAGRALGDAVRVDGEAGETLQATAVSGEAGVVTLRWLAGDGTVPPRARVERFDERGRRAAPPLRLDVR